MFVWHMIQTVVHVNAGGNQWKTYSSKSICCLQMPHFFVVANIWRAHESQKLRCMATRNEHNLSSWVSPTISQTLSDDVEAEATGTADATDECELALFVESFSTLSSQLYSSMSEFSSVKVSVMSEQWLTANRNSSFEYRPLEYFSKLSRMRLSLFFWRRLWSLRILRCCRSL